jgi:hypothetical protein
MSERVMWMSVALVLLAAVVSVQLITVAAGDRGAAAPAALAAAKRTGNPPGPLPIRIGLPF